MFFKDIPGKVKEKANLIRLVREDKVPHAQLFLGKEGAGALSMALAFISYVMCTSRTESDSCGQCSNCNATHKMVHPDIHFSYPVVKFGNLKREETTSDHFLPMWRSMCIDQPFMNISVWAESMNAENTKPNINTRECNDLLRKIGLQSFLDGPKVILMWLPEYLGKEGNRLLKMIEEPTDDTLILLVAENQDMILNTILSRCQIQKIYQYSEKEIYEYLISSFNVNQDIAHQISNVAEGNMLKAMQLIRGEETDFSNTLFNWLRVCYKGDGTEINEVVNMMANWTTDQKVQFYDYGLYFLRQYLFWLGTDEQHTNLTSNELTTAQKMKAILDIEKVELISNTLNDSILHIYRNGNFKINASADSIVIGDILRNKANTKSLRLNFA